MRSQIGYGQEERSVRISSPQEIDTPFCHPVCGMIFFLIYPRPGDPAVALQPCIRNICIDPLFLFQPVEVIVSLLLRLFPWSTHISGSMKVAVAELYILISQVISQRMHMHLSHAVGLVSAFRKFARQSMLILPGDSVLIPYSSMVILRHPCMERRPRRNAARAGAVCVVEENASARQCIQIRCFHIRMSCIAKAVSPQLICHQQKNIWSVFHLVHL